MRIKSFSLALVLAGAVLSNNALRAQEHQHDQHKEESKAGHSHAKAEIHGGEVMMTKAHHFEVVWMPDHVMVYLYDMNQKPLAAKGVTGEVVFAFQGDKKEQKATLTLMEAGKMMEEHSSEKHAEHPAEGAKQAEHPAEKHEMAHGQMSEKEMAEMHKLMSNQDHLAADVNLENVKEGEVKATFTLKGLPGNGESIATFSSKYKMMSMKHQDAGKHEEHHH